MNFSFWENQSINLCNFDGTLVFCGAFRVFDCAVDIEDRLLGCHLQKSE